MKGPAPRRSPGRPPPGNGRAMTVAGPGRGQRLPWQTDRGGRPVRRPNSSTDFPPLLFTPSCLTSLLSWGRAPGLGSREELTMFDDSGKQPPSINDAELAWFVVTVNKV